MHDYINYGKAKNILYNKMSGGIVYYVHLNGTQTLGVVFYFHYNYLHKIH